MYLTKCQMKYIKPKITLKRLYNQHNKSKWLIIVNNNKYLKNDLFRFMSILRQLLKIKFKYCPFRFTCYFQFIKLTIL